MGSDKLRMAFLGCGAIARYHLDGIVEHAERVEVTATIDTDIARAQRYAKETGGTAFASLEEALEKGDFDAITILLPHHVHERAALQCFEAGKHVLLEKPMAPSLDACERILAASKQADGVFMVAENSQYWPEIVKAKEAIEDGAIGDIITATAAFVMEFDDYWFKDKRPWRYDRDQTGGGIVIDGGAHWIRPLRIWLGEIDEVVAVTAHPLEKMQGESLARALFRFQSGQVAAFDAMMLETVLAPDAWWRIKGTKGEVTIGDGFDGGIKLFDEEHREGIPLMEPQGYAQSFGPEHVDFAAAVLDGKELEAGPEQSLGELRTALAVYRSVESRGWEKVWD